MLGVKSVCKGMTFVRLNTFERNGSSVTVSWQDSNGSFTLHGTGKGTKTRNGNGNNGLLYIILYCSHCTETGTGTWPIVSYCAGPGPIPVPGPLSVQCDWAITECDQCSLNAPVRQCFLLQWTLMAMTPLNGEEVRFKGNWHRLLLVYLLHNRIRACQKFV